MDLYSGTNMSTPIASAGDRTFRRIVYVGGAAIAIIIALFFLRGCRKVEVASKEALFVPRDLARLKGLDADAVLTYCRDEVRSADYAGVQRGAHGALWAGEANAWDKVLLAAAALEGKDVEARVIPGETPRLAWHGPRGWTIWRPEGGAADESTPNPPEGSVTTAELVTRRPELFHTLTPVFILERDNRAPERIQP